jgi:hypothetical protein
MKKVPRKWLAGTVVYATMSIASCSVDVRNDSGDQKSVDIRTPLADVSVRTNGVDPSASGLPIYPGARPLTDKNDSHSADVTVENGLFGVKVIAAKFETEDAPDAVVSFYKREMASYGEVTECRGDLDFDHPLLSNHASCRQNRSSREIQLGVGTESLRRVVAVKPRGAGSELSVVYVQTKK